MGGQITVLCYYFTDFCLYICMFIVTAKLYPRNLTNSTQATYHHLKNWRGIQPEKIPSVRMNKIDREYHIFLKAFLSNIVNFVILDTLSPFYSHHLPISRCCEAKGSSIKALPGGPSEWTNDLCLCHLRVGVARG